MPARKVGSAGADVAGSAAGADPQKTPPPGAVPTPEQLRPSLPPARPDAALPDRPPRRELGKPSDEISIDVTAYAVDASAPEALRAALAGITAPFVGPQKSYEDLVNAAAAVIQLSAAAPTGPAGKK